MSASSFPVSPAQQSAETNPSQAQSDSGFASAEAQPWDSVQTYFECITTCSLDDGECVTHCVEELRQHH
jgi:hypothetical protein